MATKPTFCAKALCIKEPNRGATALESISARKPSEIRSASTFVPTISPTAIMSAVVSVMMTNLTINIDKMAVSSKVGSPKAKKLGICNHEP